MYQIIKIKFTGSYDAIDVTEPDSLQTITEAGDNIEMIGNPVPLNQVTSKLSELNTPEVMDYAKKRIAIMQLRNQMQGWLTVVGK